MREDGYNPIRWKCAAKGCFLENAQPPSEWMCGAFKGRISFSDMDRIAERCGRALVWEQKTSVAELEPLNDDSKNGQAIMWKMLTRGQIIATIAVAGIANPLEVRAVRLCWDGNWLPIKEYCTTDFFQFCERWFRWAENNRVDSVIVNSNVIPLKRVARS